MKLMATGTFMNDHLMKALFNTLFHSLWQGVLLAIATGLIIIFTKKAKAATRYNLLIAALVLFAAGTVFTFAWQLTVQQAATQQVAYQNFQPAGHFEQAVASPVVVKAQPVVFKTQNTDANVVEAVTAYLNAHYTSIILLWFLIICAKSVQMAVGVYGVFQLRRSKVSKVDAYWEQRLIYLAQKLQISQTIRLLESGIAKVPMVIGHLKPVILIPVGLMASLSANEVEAILMHELAHIRRKDYLVNFLQSFMEIIFFFNPAVLWISQLIKEERENCCDDIAIAQTSSKTNYLNALVNCDEYRGATPAYSMALAGNKGKLINRVKRVVSNRNHSLNFAEKAVLAVCLVCAGLFMVAFSAKKVIAHHLPKKQQETAHVVVTPARLPKIDKIINPVPVKNNNTADTVKAVPVRVYNSKDFDNGTTMKTFIPGSAGKTIIAYIFKRDGVFYQINMDQGKLLSFLIDEKTVPSNQLQSYQPKINELLNEYRLEELKNSGNPVSLNSSNSSADFFNGSNQVNVNSQNSSNSSADVGVAYSQSYGQNYAGQSSFSVNNGYSPDNYHVIVPDFGDTLVKYGVIKDKRHIHAVFNKRELVINGVKQPDNVLQMLLKKYGDSVNITYTNNGSPDVRMEQQAYWTNQQRKIIDQMQREGLIKDRKDLSFSLTDKNFVINGVVQSDEVFQRYHREYVPAQAADTWNLNYNSVGGNYSAGAYGYGNSGAYYQSQREEQRRLQAERDRKLVADLLQDGLITDPKNVTFELSDKKLTINGKTQSDEIYKKYKDKYLPDNTGTGWSWNYSHHE